MNEITQQALPRRWIYRDAADINDNNFQVMSYNILAEVYTKDVGFEYCNEEMLSTNWRHPRIVEDIAGADADVVCLQEVGLAHYEKGLKPDLQLLGYEGLRMGFNHKGTGDGLAIFYRTRTLKLLWAKKCPSQDNISRRLKVGQEAALGEQTRERIEMLARRCQGVFLAKFEHMPSGKLITVGNIHTKWSEFRLPGISCLETLCALQEVRDAAQGDAFVLVGDFNSTPDFATYKMLQNGQVDPDVDHWYHKPSFNMYTWSGKPDQDPAHARVSNSTLTLHRAQGSSRITDDQVATDKMIADFLSDYLRTGIVLRSAYAEVLDREPPVTNCEGGAWPGYIHELCLDYIWYSELHFSAKAVLETPSPSEIRSTHGLPNQSLPSDHISIAATLELL